MKFFSTILAIALMATGIAQVSPLDPLKPATNTEGKWAICVGASNYKSLGELTFASGDADSMAQKLTKSFKFNPSQVRVLKDGAQPESAPTAVNIRREINTLLSDKRIEKGDLFVFYFSGHGIGTAKGDYLCATDSTVADAGETGLPVKWIVESFAKAGLKNVLFIADACRSGKENKFGTELKSLSEQSNLALILGCRPGGRSYEYPDLGHGAFTYFLMKALDDKTLREPGTGILWASNIARKVSERVASYTEKDYGDDKQVPDVWAKKSTDVLFDVDLNQGESVGELLSDIVTGKITNRAAIEKRFGVTTTEKGGVGEYLNSFVEFCFEARGYDAAIKTLRLKETLGTLPNSDLLKLARAADFIDQADLCDQTIRRLQKQNASGYYYDQALMLNPRGTATGAELFAASHRIYETDRTFETAYNCYSVAKNYGLPISAKLTLCRDFQRDFGPKTRAGLYFRAAELLTLGKPGDALLPNRDGADLKEKPTPLEESPDNNDFLRQTFEIFLPIATKEQRIRIVKIGMRSKRYGEYWRRLYDLENENAQGMIGDLPSVIENAKSPDELLTVVQIAGSDAPTFAPKIREVVAGKFPGSWTGYLALWVCEQKNDFKFPFKLSDELTKYAPSDAVFKPRLYAVIHRMMRRLVRSGVASGEASKRLSLQMMNDLLPLAPQLQNSHAYWSVLQDCSRTAERSAQSQIVASRLLVGPLLSGKLDVALASDALAFAIDSGDLVSAKALVTRFAPSLAGEESILMLQCNLAVIGDIEGLESLESLLPKSLSPVEKEIKFALDAYRLALKGEKAPALDAIKKVGKSVEIVATHLAGMAKILVDPVDQNYLDLIELMSDFDLRARSVHAKVLEVLAEELRKRAPGDTSTNDRVAKTVTEEGPLPAYNRIFFGSKAAVSSFVGTQQFNGGLVDEKSGTEMRRVYTLKVQISGKATLSYVVKKVAVVVEGTVDEFGTFRATVNPTPGSAVTHIYAKIAPVGLRKKSKSLTEYQQRIWFVSIEGACSCFVEDLAP